MSLAGPYNLGTQAGYNNTRETVDAAPVSVPVYTFGPGARAGLLQVLLFVEDLAAPGGRFVFGIVQMLLGKSEDGTVTIGQGPGFVTFVPNAPPWNTIPQPLFAAAGDSVVMTFAGLAGVTIQWNWNLALSCGLFPGSP